MANTPSSHNEIHIGHNASGPVVAGDNNHVKVTGPAEPTQTNTARDDGTVYAAANGDIHVHHDTADEEPAED
ncbi:hypothetical protein ACFW2K_13055 [Streptomyces nigra]|uniref:hypothetical protein n=1 Tax=Streptomyces TaxID=1883 RepID=UPI0006E250D5|nr:MULTISPECIES: hypothetical protein [unclassified Streptomyces]RDS61847.1 hypothetical protein DWC19_29755 [Streptomyces sp. M7]